MSKDARVEHGAARHSNEGERHKALADLDYQSNFLS